MASPLHQLKQTMFRGRESSEGFKFNPSVRIFHNFSMAWIKQSVSYKPGSMTHIPEGLRKADLTDWKLTQGGDQRAGSA
jgi:hypothetical protein